jgi:hypothetical protein
MSGLISAAVISAGAGIYGARQARKAGEQQADAVREGQAAQERMFERQNELNEPFRQAGMTGQNRYMELLGLGGNTGAQGYGRYARDFGMSDFQQDPGYQFRLSEGLKALDRQAAARGGLISGAALKAAGRYGQDYASGEYGNAFNRYQINRSNQLNPLAALAGMGQTATGAMSNAAGVQGQNMMNSLTDIGNARAAGRMGSTNALMSSVGQGMNFYQNDRLMNMYANNMYNRRGGAAPIENRTLPFDYTPGIED